MQPQEPAIAVLVRQEAAAPPLARANRRSPAAQPVRLVTINQLEKLLFSINGAKAVRVLTSTQLRMRKTNNQYYDLVQKLQEHSAFLNFNYEAAVNRQRAREDKRAAFTAQPRAWGVRLPNSCLVFHNNQYYMEAKVEQSGLAQYTFRGRPIDYSVIESFCPPRAAPNQGIDKPVIVRDFSTLSVLEVVIDGTRYRVREESRRRRRREMRERAAWLMQAIADPQVVPVGVPA